MKIEKMTQSELIRTYVRVVTAMGGNGMTPIHGDLTHGLAEHVASIALGAHLLKPNTRDIDAIGMTGSDQVRYQIKGCSYKRRPGDARTGIIKGLEPQTFEFLAVIVFDRQHLVRRAAKIPHYVVMDKRSWNKQNKGYYLCITNLLMQDKRITNIMKFVPAELKGVPLDPEAED